MSFDVWVRKSPHGSPTRQPSLEEVLGRLIDPPGETSNLQQRLEKVKQSAASLPGVTRMENTSVRLGEEVKPQISTT